MSKYDIYGKGRYLCTVNQTLRITGTAFDDISPPHIEECCRNAMWWGIRSNHRGLIIIPQGKTKRADVTSLAEIAPKVYPSKHPKTRKKAQTYRKGRGSQFLKKAAHTINDLDPLNSRIFGKSKSAAGGVI